MGWRKARVRIVKEIRTWSVEPGDERLWPARSEHTLIQWWNNPELPPVDASWWTDFDIDGAHILRPNDVELIEVIEGRESH